MNKVLLVCICLCIINIGISAERYTGRLFSFREVRNLNTELDNIYNKIRELNNVTVKRGGVVDTYSVALNTTTATASVNTITIVINGTTYTVLTT